MLHGSGSLLHSSSCANQAKPVATITLPVGLPGRRSHATSPLATNDHPTSREMAISAPPAGYCAPAISAAAPMPAASAAGTRARRAGASVMGESLGGIRAGFQPRRRRAVRPGSHQLARPSRTIAAGTITERTSVASISTAAPRPKPICWNITSCPVANPANTATMISAAPVISRAVVRTPNAALSRVSPSPASARGSGSAGTRGSPSRGRTGS